MDSPFTRQTTAFICHPNATAIAHEIDLAMARCGYLPSDGAVDDSIEVTLSDGVGMWHVMRMLPSDGIWQLASEDGETLLQQLCAQLSVPGFATVFDVDDPASEVFIEMDAQGQLRASGEWRGTDALGSIVLTQPVRPFSSGLKSLWQQGVMEAAIEGLALSPVASFLRIALQRLAGESAVATGERGSAIVFARRYLPATEAERHAFIEQRIAERAAADAAVEEDAQTVSEPGTEAVDMNAVAAEDLPGSSAMDSAASSLADVQHGAAEAEMQTPVAVRYADGTPVVVGDAVAIDGGAVGARVHAVHAGAEGDSNHQVTLEVGGTLREIAGADFQTRCTRVATGVTSGAEADERTVAHLRERAAQGDGHAMLLLGIRLLRGAGVARDPRQAYEQLLPAADRGEVLAQYLVGVMSKHRSRSVRYWRLAADQGHAAAQFCLGLALLRDPGGGADRVAGMQWLERAADQGNLAALYDLGVMRFCPDAPLIEEPDTRLAAFEARAAAGDVVAAWVLVQAWIKGQTLDLAAAVRTLSEAAEANRVLAQATLKQLTECAPRLSDVLRREIEQGLSRLSAGTPAASATALSEATLSESNVRAGESPRIDEPQETRTPIQSEKAPTADQPPSLAADSSAEASGLTTAADDDDAMGTLAGALDRWAAEKENDAEQPPSLKASDTFSEDGPHAASAAGTEVVPETAPWSADPGSLAWRETDAMPIGPHETPADEQPPTIWDVDRLSVDNTSPAPPAGGMDLAFDSLVAPEAESSAAPTLADESVAAQSLALGEALQLAAQADAAKEPEQVASETAGNTSGEGDELSEEDREFLGVFKGLNSLDDLEELAQKALYDETAPIPLDGDDPDTQLGAQGDAQGHAEVGPTAQESPSPSSAPAVPTGSATPARKPWWKLW